MKKLNFGIIGCNRIAYKHAEPLKIMKRQTCFMYDIIGERAADYKNKYGAEEHYTDYHEMLEN